MKQRNAINIFVLRTNVFHSGIERLRMRTSLGYWVTYVVDIYLNISESRYQTKDQYDFKHYEFPLSLWVNVGVVSFNRQLSLPSQSFSTLTFETFLNNLCS